MKNVKICTCYLMVLIIIFTISCVVSISLYADDEIYTELFAQREEYLRDNYKDSIESGSWGEYPPVCIEQYFDHYLAVILYTDAADQLTFEKAEDLMESGGTIFDGCSDEIGQFYIRCPNLLSGVEITGSTLREFVRYYDISKQELVDAYKEMQENPNAIRTVLSCLTDAEFESGRDADGYFGTWDIPEFIIEAIYVEDEVIAQNLLCMPFAVYMEDYSHKASSQTKIACDAALFNLSGQTIWCTDEEFTEFLKCDLTSVGMKNFIEYLKGIEKMDRDPEMNYSRLQRLEAAREAQLKAAETGDGAVTAMVIVALAVPTLAAVVLAKRKRRI